jgi:ribosomal protein S27AE
MMGWFVRATGRMQKGLLPWMGPAQVQDVEGQTVRTRDAMCPMCGHPLAAHTFDRSANRPTRMECPAP